MVFRCSDCKKDKSDTEFHNSKGTKSGKAYVCKECSKFSYISGLIIIEKDTIKRLEDVVPNLEKK